MDAEGLRLTLDENIAWVRENLAEIICLEAQLEGVMVTEQQVRDVLDGKAVASLTMVDTRAVNNLKAAWRYVLEEPHDIGYESLCKLDKLIGAGGLVDNAGKLRTDPMRIEDSEYIAPALPERDIKEQLSKLMSITNEPLRALMIFAWICRTQPFAAGNLRCAQLFANDILIHGGCGYLAVPTHEKAELFNHLAQFYETNNPDDVINLLAASCLA